jgi:hypothetical protein
MTRNLWRSQIANGRVFELRSKSKKYPAPCALVIDEDANGRSSRVFAAVDQYGVIGNWWPARRHNPNITVDWLLPEKFNNSRVLRRRRDLERFDADDLALIRYGLALDFSGCIHGSSNNTRVPTVIPADWTLFWVAPWADDDFRWIDVDPELTRLLHGAWHFQNRGGRRSLGYKFGWACGTRHTGERLIHIRRFLRKRHGTALIEQPVKIARWTDGQNVYTEEIRRDCPALEFRWLMVQRANGDEIGICRQ